MVDGWLKSGDCVPSLYLAGVRGSRTYLPHSSRGITDFKSVCAGPIGSYRPILLGRYACNVLLRSLDSSGQHGSFNVLLN